MVYKLAKSAARPTIASVDLDALQDNLRSLKSHARSKLFLATIKTNAYGHGLVPVAKAAIEAGADWLGITTVEEGVKLRNHGVMRPLLLLSNSFENQIADIISNELTASISSVYLAKKFNEEALNQNRIAKLHLKIDTGLHRFGIQPSEALQLCKKCFTLPGLEWEGIYTHFSDADEGDWEKTEQQYQMFVDVVSTLKKHGYTFQVRHVGGSTITIERPDMHFDMVRPGISLFGYYPAERQKEYLTLTPVMQLSTKILIIKYVSTQQTVGYGSHYKTEGAKRIAVLPIGLGDGYHRALSSKGFVLINNHFAKIIGNISLDQTMVDITNIPQAREGDEVILIGKMGDEVISADDLARWMGSIVDEVLACFTERIPRLYNK